MRRKLGPLRGRKTIRNLPSITARPQGGGVPITVPTAILLDAFDSLAGYSVLNGSLQALDTANRQQGAASLKLTGPGGSQTVSSTAKPNILPSSAPSELGTVAFLARFNDLDVLSLQPQIGYNAGAGGNYYGPAAFPIGTVEPGWRWLAFHASEVAELQNTAPGLIGFRPLVNMRNGVNQAVVNFDSLLMNAKGVPTAMFGFDDMFDTIYTVALPILQSLGLKGTVYFTLNQVGQPGKLTEAQIIELYSVYGWDIAVNGTVDDTSMTSKGTVANAIAGLNAGRAWLSARGLTRAMDHFCYPNGAAWDNTGGTGAEFYIGKLQAAARAAGFKTGRLASGSSLYTRFGFADQAFYLPSPAMSGQTFAQLQAGIDQVILRGVTQEFYIHKLEDTPTGNSTATAIFQQVAAYIASKKSEIAALTKSRQYERDISTLMPSPVTATLPAFGMRGDNAAALATQNAYMAPVEVAGAHLFLEAGQTWAENIAIALQQEAAYAGSTAIFDVAFPIATPTQSLLDTAAGLYDSEIDQLGRIVSRMCKNDYIPIRPGHEPNHRTAFPAWTYNKAGGAAPYVAAMRRVIGRLKVIDPRFKFIWCLVPNPTKWDPSFQWQDGYAGDDMIDGITCDPYFVESQGLNQQQDILRKIAGTAGDLTDGFDGFRAFALSRGKEFFGFSEFGIDQDGRDWLAGMERWSCGKPIKHAFYWDKNAQFVNKLTDGSKPIAEKTIRRMFGAGSAWQARRDGAYHPLNALAGKILAFWQFDRDDLLDISGGRVSGARDMISYYNALQATTANQPGYDTSWAGTIGCLTWDGARLLSVPNTLMSGAVDVELWANVQNEAVDTTTLRTILAIGGGSFGTQIRLSKRAADGVLQVVTGIGGSSVVTVAATQASNVGRSLVRAKVTPSQTSIEVDGVAGSPVAAVPSITAGATLIGNLSALGNGWQGKIRDIYITQGLTTAEADALRTYMTARK